MYTSCPPNQLSSRIRPTLKDKKLLSEGAPRQGYRRDHRWGYLALLLLGVGLILLESWLGGQLVYKLGVGVR